MDLSLLLKVTLALGAGLVTSILASRVRASVRHLILAATFGALVALPIASAFPTALEVTIPVGAETIREMVAPVVEQALTTGEPPDVLRNDLHPAPAGAWRLRSNVGRDDHVRKFPQCVTLGQRLRLGDIESHSGELLAVERFH